MARRCLTDSDPGGLHDPFNHCPDMAGRLGTCQLVRVPDPHYCSGFRFERLYVSTPEEAAGYDSHTWVTEIGEKLFGTIFGFFNNAISVVTGGIITDWLGSGHTLESLLGQVVSNGSDKLASLTDEIGAKINHLIAGNINRSAEAMGEFVGIANAQKDIVGGLHKQLDKWIEDGRTDAYVAWEEKERLAEIAAEQLRADAAWAEAIKDGLFSELTTATFERLKQNDLTLFDRADELMGFTFNHIDLNRKIMYTMALEHGQTVAASFAAVAESDLETANELLLESVIKPLAMGEAYYTAIKQAGKATREEYRGSLMEEAVTQIELATELMLTDKAPLEWLKQQLRGE